MNDLPAFDPQLGLEEIEGGLSWAVWKGAAALLAREGFEGPADAIENILAGADPRDEFCLAGLRAERKEMRNRLIVDLYAASYAELPFAQAITKLSGDWREYEGRAAARDRYANEVPAHYSPKWRVFWDILKLGERIPCARQLRNILPVDLVR